MTALKADKQKALCQWCDQIIDISSRGESTLKSHSTSEKHKQNSQCKQRVTLSSFGFRSRVGTSICWTSGNKKVCVEAGTSTSFTRSHLKSVS